MGRGRGGDGKEGGRGWGKGRGAQATGCLSEVTHSHACLMGSVWCVVVSGCCAMVCFFLDRGWTLEAYFRSTLRSDI